MATDPTGRTSHLPDMHRGQGWKQPVRVATSSNTGPSGLGTVDSVSITSGDRVLLMGQTAAASNGIYVASSGWWPRAHDMDQDATTAIPAEEVLGAMVYVVAGASNGGKMFRTTNTTAPILGTTAITWSNFGATVSGYQTVTNGGLETLSTVAASGATETVDLANGNWHDITLTASCTITVIGYSAGSGCSALVALRQDATGGRSVTWDTDIVWTGDDQPDTAANTVTWFVLWSGEGDSVIYGIKVGGGGSSTSPLTTKGDLWGYSTVDARFAVGSNGTGIVADPAESLGLRYTLAALAGELLMQDGVSNPPVPIETETQDDWLYQDL